MADQLDGDRPRPRGPGSTAPSRVGFASALRRTNMNPASAADFATQLGQLEDAAEGRPAKRDVFALAKSMIEMPLNEVRRLLHYDEHLHRVGAVSVMDFRAGKHDPARLRDYLERHVPGLPATILRHAIRHLPERERRELRARSST